MEERKKIMAICGSIRKNSTNLSLINAIADLTSDIFEIDVFKGLAKLPHFNPDADDEFVVTEVIDFRSQIREADGVIFCTPEYAMGIPGTLKNAIDWTVSSCEFSHKPVAIITASSSGEKAHASLIETLTIIESKTNPDIQLLISFAKTKINSENKITDKNTLANVKKLIENFNKVIEAN